MAESTVPPARTVPTRASTADLLVDVVAEVPDHTLFLRRIGAVWHDVTARVFEAEVIALAKGLIAAGIGPGDRVALMSRTRYEWTLVDFAIWYAGAVSVPVYETSSAEQVEWILGDSAAVAVVVETDLHARLVGELRERLPALAQAWVIDSGDLDLLVDAGVALDDGEVTARRTDIDAAALATLIYTSGTTGRPKGCRLTHANLLTESYNVVASTGDALFNPDDTTLLFLPLAHVLARIVELAAVHGRVRVAHTSDVTQVMADLQATSPTFLLAVPRVFEKIYNGAVQKAETSGRGRVLRAAVATAIAYSEALDHTGPALGLRARHAAMDRIVYRKLRSALGGRVRYAVSGGAPLGPRLGHFFRGVGLTVLEGYGLTETSAGAALNLPGALKIGTVGRPVPGTSIRTTEDGEVLVRGPIVFDGYHNDPHATADAFTDGWLRTGDLGELDADGFLRITGRRKEIIITAGGKNVAPAALEDRLRAHRLISQCMVVGDGHPYIACLVTLDADVLPVWLAARGKPVVPVSEGVRDPDVVAEVQRAVDDANHSVSKAEAIKRFRILPVDFTEAGGQLTPTQKLRRGEVVKEFAADIDALYS